MTFAYLGAGHMHHNHQTMWGTESALEGCLPLPLFSVPHSFLGHLGDGNSACEAVQLRMTTPPMHSELIAACFYNLSFLNNLLPLYQTTFPIGLFSLSVPTGGFRSTSVIPMTATPFLSSSTSPASTCTPPLSLPSPWSRTSPPFFNRALTNPLAVELRSARRPTPRTSMYTTATFRTDPPSNEVA